MKYKQKKLKRNQPNYEQIPFFSLIITMVIFVISVVLLFHFGE